MVFTAQQSAEIDRRIIEMITAVMGVGEYSRLCQGIANRRANELAADAAESQIDLVIKAIELIKDNATDVNDVRKIIADEVRGFARKRHYQPYR